MDSTATILQLLQILLHAAVFVAAFIALLVAHDLADHWIQTEHQACTKGNASWAGRLACACHVASYTAAGVVAVVVVAHLLHLPLAPGRLAIAFTVSAATHYFADRRGPLRRLAELSGHGNFWKLGAPREGRDDNPTLGTGAYVMDQSFHKVWLLVAALIIAV